MVDDLAFENLKNILRDELATLVDREREVLELRYGLIDGKGKTLEELGTIYGLTRERIRQIEAKAIKKLRLQARADKLRDFYS